MESIEVAAGAGPAWWRVSFRRGQQRGLELGSFRENGLDRWSYGKIEGKNERKEKNGEDDGELGG